MRENGQLCVNGATAGSRLYPRRVVTLSAAKGRSHVRAPFTKALSTPGSRLPDEAVSSQCGFDHPLPTNSSPEF